MRLIRTIKRHKRPLQICGWPSAELEQLLTQAEEEETRSVFSLGKRYSREANHRGTLLELYELESLSRLMFRNARRPFGP